MNFRLLVFYIALVFSSVLALTSFLYEKNWNHVLTLQVVSFIITYILLSSIFERFINQRISNIYKLIRNLKLGKDFKEVLAEHANSDPI
ncbi:MAG TPA: sensor histidine kinase, partial [Sphingobacterium sp.]|nr:sensor histidine kinase [Sphingobacterium sp.]